MKFVTKQIRWSDLLFVAVAISVVVFYALVAQGGFPLDDSWIHQVYGRNLAETGQWAFVPGIPSAASTSPLYTVVLAIGYKLNIPFKAWTYFLGIIALSVTGMFGARLTERLFPKPPLVSVIAGLAQVTAWHLVWAAASGMETMLFGMWTLTLIWLGWRELDELSTSTQDVVIRGAVFGIVTALATMTRPEGIVLGGLVGLAILVGRPHAKATTFLGWSIGASLAFLIAIAPYLALNLQLTGGFLPDTAAAKQAENSVLLAESLLERLIKMVLPLVAGSQIFLIPGVVYFVVLEIRRLRHQRQAILYLIPLLWAAGLIVLYAVRLPAYYQHGRYVIPALPSIILCGVVGTVGLLKVSQKSVAGRVVSRSLAISSLIAFVYFLFQGAIVYRQDVTIIDEEMVAAANWIKSNVSPDEMLAVHDIGAVGYFAPRPILDLAGLVSPEIIPFILDEEPLWNWLQEKGARYLMAFPDQIPGDDPNDPRLCEVFTTAGQASIRAGGANMAIYALNWDGACPNP